MKQTSNLYVNSISSDSKSCPQIFHLIVVKRQLSLITIVIITVIIVVALQENSFQSPIVS